MGWTIYATTHPKFIAFKDNLKKIGYAALHKRLVKPGRTANYAMTLMFLSRSLNSERLRDGRSLGLMTNSWQTQKAAQDCLTPSCSIRVNVL